jgi:hypothetical protein
MQAMQRSVIGYDHQANVFNSVDYMLLEESMGYFVNDGTVNFRDVQPQDLHIQVETPDDCVIL